MPTTANSTPIGTLDFELGFNQADLKSQIEKCLKDAGKNGVDALNKQLDSMGGSGTIKKFKGIEDLGKQLQDTLEKAYKNATQHMSGNPSIDDYWKKSYEGMRKSTDGIVQQIENLTRAQERYAKWQWSHRVTYQDWHEGVGQALMGRPGSLPIGSDPRTADPSFQGVNWADGASAAERQRSARMQLLTTMAGRYGGDVLGGGVGAYSDLMGTSQQLGQAGFGRAASAAATVAIPAAIGYGGLKLGSKLGDWTEGINDPGMASSNPSRAWEYKPKGANSFNFLEKAAGMGGYNIANDSMQRFYNNTTANTPGHVFENVNQAVHMAPQEISYRQHVQAGKGATAAEQHAHEMRDQISKKTHEYNTERNRSDTLRDIERRTEFLERPEAAERKGFYNSRWREELFGGSGPQRQETEGEMETKEKANEAEKRRNLTRKEIELTEKKLAAITDKGGDGTTRNLKVRELLADQQSQVARLAVEEYEAKKAVAAYHQQSVIGNKAFEAKTKAYSKAKSDHFETIDRRKEAVASQRRMAAIHDRAAIRDRTLRFTGGLSDRNKQISERIAELKKPKRGVLGVSSASGFRSVMQQSLQHGMEKEKEIKNLEAEKRGSELFAQAATRMSEVLEQAPDFVRGIKDALGMAP